MNKINRNFLVVGDGGSPTSNKKNCVISSRKKQTPFFFLIMRLNFRIVLFCMCFALCLATIIFWSSCGDPPRNFLPKWNGRYYEDANQHVVSESLISDIDCVINQEKVVSCKRQGDEIYLPFSFIREYFEIFGSLGSTSKGISQFDWSHSNSKVNFPKGIYDPTGFFMNFETFNVEMRDRVKCISGEEGVPLSTQWEPQGYYYPTQIAQFALSHYSKNLTDPEPRRKVLEDGDQEKSDWLIPNGSNLTRIFNDNVSSIVINYLTNSQYESAVSLNLEQVLDLVLSIDILLKANSSLMVTLEIRETRKQYNIYYIVADLLLSVQDDNFYYGIGTNTEQWKHLTRDLLVDFQKGLSNSNLNSNNNININNNNINNNNINNNINNYNNNNNNNNVNNNLITDKKKKYRRPDIKVLCIAFLGSGSFDNLTFSTSEHMAHFYNAAEWFVKHQDPKSGGWPNGVRRKLSEFNELKPGWHSAMGQGQAISVLARAYYHSKHDPKYLKAAIDGMRPFRVPSKQGGVLAKFLGKFEWYEEYPTTPASFVLNGFIYSLFGLYDLYAVAPFAKEAKLLYEQGLITLKKMLPLFDTGSGTIYDLRHFTLSIEPNIARWDYHSTHVNQLLLLATIDRDPIISKTAERWRSYMYGKRAAHN